jgi:hypothetical protein
MALGVAATDVALLRNFNTDASRTRVEAQIINSSFNILSLGSCVRIVGLGLECAGRKGNSVICTLCSCTNHLGEYQANGRSMGQGRSLEQMPDARLIKFIIPYVMYTSLKCHNFKFTMKSESVALKTFKAALLL